MKQQPLRRKEVRRLGLVRCVFVSDSRNRVQNQDLPTEYVGSYYCTMMCRCVCVMQMCTFNRNQSVGESSSVSIHQQTHPPRNAHFHYAQSERESESETDCAFAIVCAERLRLARTMNGDYY